MPARKIALITGSILLPLFLLLLSYQLTISLYPLTSAQQEVFQFLWEDTALESDYTAAEISHLQDVVKVMDGVDIFFFTNGLVLLFLLIYFWKDKIQLQKLLRYGGITSMTMIGIILLGILLAFNTSFTTFHLIFFPQGNWQFAADSLLIQAFPGEFFVRIGLVIFIGAFILGSLFILLSFLLKHDPTDNQTKRN